MGRVYAVEEESKRRFLLRLECDEPGCSRHTKPGDIEGWLKRGQTDGFGNSLEWYYCPVHAD
jgi:hypothetical protein